MPEDQLVKYELNPATWERTPLPITKVSSFNVPPLQASQRLEQGVGDAWVYNICTVLPSILWPSPSKILDKEIFFLFAIFLFLLNTLQYTNDPSSRNDLAQMPPAPKLRNPDLNQTGELSPCTWDLTLASGVSSGPPHRKVTCLPQTDTRFWNSDSAAKAVKPADDSLSRSGCVSCECSPSHCHWPVSLWNGVWGVGNVENWST